MSCQYPVHTVHAFVQVIFPLGSHRKRGGKMLRPGTTSAGALWRPWTKTLASDGLWQRPCYQKRCGPVCNPAGASHLTYLNIISWTSDDGTQDEDDEARIELHLIWKLQVGRYLWGCREGGQMHSNTIQMLGLHVTAVLSPLVQSLSPGQEMSGSCAAFGVGAMIEECQECPWVATNITSTSKSCRLLQTKIPKLALLHVVWAIVAHTHTGTLLVWLCILPKWNLPN